MYCNKCGKKNPERSKFCKHCGAKFNKRSTVNAPIEDKPSNIGAWIFGAVVVLMIIGLIYTLNKPTDSIPASSIYNTDTTTDTLSEFKTNYQNAFIQSCIKEGGEDSSIIALCTCTANYIVSNYDEAQLTTMDKEYRSTGELPQEILDAANTCRPN